MRSIQLTAIDLERERSAREPAVITQEFDDLERPIDEPAPTAVAEDTSIFFPVTIFVDDVREFYPRKGGRDGTRVVYKNGAARPVKETYDEVVAKFASLNN